MLSSWEMLSLAVLALLIFGPERLPGMARSLGKTLSGLRREASSTIDELRRSGDLDELKRSAGAAELREASSLLRAEADQLGAAATEAAKATEKDPGAAALAATPAPYDPDAT